jgi:predicted dinucleotide-binding enzyme
MKIGILGTGDVGRALGKGFLALGHEVKLGSREANNEKAAAWVKEGGPRASAGTFTDAAAFGELVVLATLGAANQDASHGFPPRLALSGNDSGGEQVQRLAPGAKVVKAFNIVGNTHMFKPNFPGGPPDMFICGNDEGAKRQVAELLKDFGWNTTDIGGIEGSRYLEAMCIVWVMYAVRTNQWNHAFKMLRK